MKQQFEMFAAYNAWANEIIYNAAAELSETELHQKTGAFFESVCGTLNHLLVADRIWLTRFTGIGEAPSKLDAVLHRDFAPLREARRAEDKRIIEWVRGLDDAALTGQVTYARAGKTITQLLWPAMSHLFNHQTHHRGQTHAILTTLGKPSLGLDLLIFLRTTGAEYL